MSDHSTFLLPEQKVFGAAAAQRRDLNEANEPLLPETEFTGVVPTAADRKITDKPFALALAAATIFWLISGFCSVGSADMTWLTQLSSASQSYAPEFSVAKTMSVFSGSSYFLSLRRAVAASPGSESCSSILLKSSVSLSLPI